MKFEELRCKTISPSMSSKEIKDALIERRVWLNTNEEKLSQGVKLILDALITYASKAFTARFRGTYKQRYDFFNRMFLLASRSGSSLEKEKSFYEQVNGSLNAITKSSSTLKNSVRPVSNRERNSFIGQLEKHNPNYRDAKKGIIEGILGTGLVLSMMTRDPSYILYSALILLMQLIPSSLFSNVNSGENNPSMLGMLVYHNEGVRELGSTLHNKLSPQRISHRILGLFGRGTNAALTLAEKGVERTERLAGIHQRLEYQQPRGSIKEMEDEGVELLKNSP